MKETTQLPVWLVVVLTVVPAVLAGGSAVLATWLGGARKAAKELDQWRRREETMRMLRWAAEMVVNGGRDGAAQGGQQEGGQLMGILVLDALDRSKPTMLQPEDQGILDAVLDAALAAPLEAVREYSDQTGRYDVEEVPESGRT